MAEATVIDSSGRLMLVRTVNNPDSVTEADWPALQAVPDNVERAELDPTNRSVKELFIEAVARDASGGVVAGTVSMQLVSINKVGMFEVVGGSAIQATISTGAGVLLPSAGACTCTVRVVGTTGLATATKLRIYMRRAG